MLDPNSPNVMEVRIGLAIPKKDGDPWTVVIETGDKKKGEIIRQWTQDFTTKEAAQAEATKVTRLMAKQFPGCEVLEAA